MEDVDFGYRDGAPVLRGVTLTLAPGETVALTGPSGGGKSTLATLLVRLAEPARGRIFCGEVPLGDVDLDAWRAQVAWIPQRPVVVAGTMAENVRLAAPAAGEEAVGRALRDAGLGPLVEALPEGSATLVGDGGRPLSAGEAQRLALARAFVRDAALVILDEPTAHLDADTARAVNASIVALCVGRTALIITHDPDLATAADRTVVLEAGRLTGAAVRQELAA